MRISDWSSDVCSSDLESKDTQERLGKSRVWIIDPVDGTREYGESRTPWAVHIALATDGVATVGAVALPGLGLTLRSDQPTARPFANTPVNMVVIGTGPAAEAVAVAEASGAELLRMGSAGAKEIGIAACRNEYVNTYNTR